MPNEEWRPGATRQTLEQRARLLSRIRAFFSARDVLEVETPILSAAGSPAPYIDSFVTQGEEVRYLHTSPEFAMKRLLAAGSGAIYQIAKVFRVAECGARHNPEFTLLEWYRPAYTLMELMEEVAALVREVLGEQLPRAAEFIPYRMAFLHRLGLDPLSAGCEELAQCAHRLGHDGSHLEAGDRDGWLDLLLTAEVEPGLGRGRLSFLYDYPASQAALARLNPDDDRVAERFELYFNGVELANGFRELTDADEQRRRFEEENCQRQRQGREAVVVDERFLAALEAGMPDACGVALGVDRLLMALLGLETIDEVLSFADARA